MWGSSATNLQTSQGSPDPPWPWNSLVGPLEKQKISQYSPAPVPLPPFLEGCGESLHVWGVMTPIGIPLI